jgi:hypothetical protein
VDNTRTAQSLIIKAEDQKKLYDTSFKWLTRKKEFISIKDMETSHLFYTVRMIWNNTCIKGWEVGKVKRYVFAPCYTPGYLRKSVFNILLELSKRDNLPSYFITELKEMYSKFKKRINDAEIL